MRQHAQVVTDGTEGVQPEGEMVLAVEAAYDQAWCSGNVEAVVSCLRRDAVLINPRGQVAVGHDAIREALGAFLSTEAKGSLHRSSVDRITFVREDVAVVDGHAVIELPGAGANMEHPFTDVLVRDDEGWVIAHVRAYQYDDNA